ncbi:hypothetical protein M513_09322 [Trichuris suis]|uniref:Uncharacterized protein n=1 Tax=Trichuris suis TaxID=68888 RepID=A0A085LY09_9BILA|nr:hypothetical protein M513_09322 [Trichuris suis]
MDQASEGTADYSDLATIRRELDNLRQELATLKVSGTITGGNSAVRQLLVHMELGAMEKHNVDAGVGATLAKSQQASQSRTAEVANGIDGSARRLPTSMLLQSNSPETHRVGLNGGVKSATEQRQTSHPLTVHDEDAYSARPAEPELVRARMGAPLSLGDNRFNDDPILSQSMASDYWISRLEDREAIITDQCRVSSGIDPALGVEPYDGDPRKWDMFVGSFRALMHDVMPSDAIRIAYLRKLLSPQVLDSVATYLYNPALYHQALRTLKHRYSDRRLIAQYSVKALRNIKPLRPEDVAELDRFACELHGFTTLRPVTSWNCTQPAICTT